MSQLDETLESCEYTLDLGSGVPIPERDIALREQIFEYALSKADSEFHRAVSHLYEYWDRVNVKFFDRLLIPPVILLDEPGATTCYGECTTESGFGGSNQIQVRPSILDGTLQDLKNGTRNRKGLMRFAEHVLLHETIHQWAHECVSRPVVVAESKNYNGHGPIFSAKANEIGTKLGYPPVRKTNKARGKGKGLPSPSQWPHNVCPREYYLGAYVPTSRDEEAHLLQQLEVLLGRHGLEKVIGTAQKVWPCLVDKDGRRLAEYRR